jgi:hypothetical protein
MEAARKQSLVVSEALRAATITLNNRLRNVLHG